jgi:hypothetical protein
VTAPNAPPLGAAVIDAAALGAQMIDAARAALSGREAMLRAMGETELRRLAGALADIQSMLERGEIDPDRAKVLANIHQISVRSVFRSIEGLTLVATEEAMQAITRTGAAVVNPAIGFKLL